MLTGSDCKKNPVEPPSPNPPDTTSHAFTFQQLSWGNGGGASFLNDVAILSDSNIWCAAGILLIEYDTLGQQIYTPYGAAHWDGTNWNLVKLPTSIGLNYTQYLTPTGIIAFSSTDLWLANGGGVQRFDGKVIT